MPFSHRQELFRKTRVLADDIVGGCTDKQDQIVCLFQQALSASCTAASFVGTRLLIVIDHLVMSLEGLGAPVTLISNSDEQPSWIIEHLLPEACPAFLVGASVIAVVLNHFCLLTVLHVCSAPLQQQYFHTSLAATMGQVSDYHMMCKLKTDSLASVGTVTSTKHGCQTYLLAPAIHA